MPRKSGKARIGTLTGILGAWNAFTLVIEHIKRQRNARVKHESAGVHMLEKKEREACFCKGEQRTRVFCSTAPQAL